MLRVLRGARRPRPCCPARVPTPKAGEEATRDLVVSRHQVESGPQIRPHISAMRVEDGAEVLGLGSPEVCIQGPRNRWARATTGAVKHGSPPLCPGREAEQKTHETSRLPISELARFPSRCRRGVPRLGASPTRTTLGTRVPAESTQVSGAQRGNPPTPRSDERLQSARP